MNSDSQAEKKQELEIALLKLFKKFTEETGLIVDDVHVGIIENIEFGGARRIVYRQPEVKAYQV